MVRSSRIVSSGSGGSIPCWALAVPYAVGSILAVLTALFLRIVGFDRDRAVYPTLLIVIASYYVLFAVIGGAGSALSIELVALIVFTLVAVVGFRTSLWWIVGALAGHGG